MLPISLYTLYYDCIVRRYLYMYRLMYDFICLRLVMFISERIGNLDG